RPRRAVDPPRRVAEDQPGRVRRVRRVVGRRKVDAHAPDARLRDADDRHGALRWPGPVVARHPHGAAAAGRRAPGEPGDADRDLPEHRRRQLADARRGMGGSRKGRPGRGYPRDADGHAHLRVGGRRYALGRPAAAADDRARDREQAEDHLPRRGDERPRQSRAGDRHREHGQDGRDPDRDRAPAEHDRERRSHLLSARRPDCRIGHLRGAHAEGRPVRPARAPADGVSPGMDAASRRERRLAVLESLGIRGAVADEIVASDPLPYTRPATAPALDLPLPDEPLAACWAQWADDARHDGVFETLRRHLVQLRFPVQAGISETDAYRAATRRGRFEEADAFAPGLELARPDALELDIVETMGGRLPVIVAGDRRDFVALVQALTTRNEPEPVPDSMGACFVKGLNNWSRVALYRDAWTKQTGRTDAAAWAEEFSRLVPQRELYQDRLIILS